MSFHNHDAFGLLIDVESKPVSHQLRLLPKQLQEIEDMELIQVIGVVQVMLLGQEIQDQLMVQKVELNLVHRAPQLLLHLRGTQILYQLHQIIYLMMKTDLLHHSSKISR